MNKVSLEEYLKHKGKGTEDSFLKNFTYQYNEDQQPDSVDKIEHEGNLEETKEFIEKTNKEEVDKYFIYHKVVGSDFEQKFVIIKKTENQNDIEDPKIKKDWKEKLKSWLTKLLKIEYLVLVFLLGLIILGLINHQKIYHFIEDFFMENPPPIKLISREELLQNIPQQTDVTSYNHADLNIYKSELIKELAKSKYKNVRYFTLMYDENNSQYIFLVFDKHSNNEVKYVKRQFIKKISDELNENIKSIILIENKKLLEKK